ncbi:MAG: acetate kinase [bacterium]|nr:acetate kinase [Bacteroidales bacterium]MCI6917798.1 acetate kinase [bacterium]MDY2649555.1 acetate kinase [Candidatus Egerieousia sp.]MDD5963720.1 acetate kinase [bacterium]MDD7236601.1 acetate kinase [bacterium]
MIILVLNCGSSSLKYQLLDMRSNDDFSLLAKGLVERIGMEMGDITHTVTGREKEKLRLPIKDHAEGINQVLALLTDKDKGILKSVSEIDAVGHRVAHGGEFFSSSVKVDADVIEKIERCCELAPLHNPANLLGIKAMEKLIPGLPQVAVFDTSFHQTMPDYAYIYPLPYKYYEQDKIRRYGFHGTSHKFVAQTGAELAGLDMAKSKIITCHLGNGSSITAIENGKSIDTSMGFTPNEGIIMGTRSGSVDAGALTFLMDKYGMDTAKLNSVLNKESGFLGVSGVSSDSRDIEAAAGEGNGRALLTQKIFRYDVLKYIGAYAAAMNGVDLIIFTGGMGENDYISRAEICKRLTYLGVDFDEAVNDKLRGKNTILTKPGSKVKVAIIATNEELVIARDTMNIVK